MLASVLKKLLKMLVLLSEKWKLATWEFSKLPVKTATKIILGEEHSTLHREIKLRRLLSVLISHSTKLKPPL